MERRIFGVETEFGIRYIPRGLGPLAPEEAARRLFKPVVDSWRSTNIFLPNGGRLYLDVLTLNMQRPKPLPCVIYSLTIKPVNTSSTIW